MSATPFPVIGALAPLVTSLALWSVTRSTFALLGAVIAPTVVIAHYLDGRRRARLAERLRVDHDAQMSIVETEAARIRDRDRLRQLRSEHPSVADIACSAGWLPALNGSTRVRAGALLDGSPWLVDLSDGIAVLGTGDAADAVWWSLVVHGTAQLGEPRRSIHQLAWPNGALLIRGEVGSAALVITCSGDSVSSVMRRGGLPEGGDWVLDDVSRATDVLARCASMRSTLFFRDRQRCARGIGTAGTEPLVLDPSDETPHILITGRTGSGKSEVFTTLVLDWAERYEPNELVIVGFDFKGGATLTPLSGLPHVAAIVTDLDSNAPRALAGLTHELRRREEAFASQGVARIDDATGVPRLVVAIDEAHELVRRFPEAHDVLADIARRGRSLGVHLLVAVQQPSGVLRDGVLANIPVRIARPANTTFELSATVGKPVGVGPGRDEALVVLGDGQIVTVTLRRSGPSDIDDLARRSTGSRASPPWCPPLTSRLWRHDGIGFGILDDVAHARQVEAVWVPSDGDVVVVGERGSGRTTALHALARDHSATWVGGIDDLDDPVTPLVIVDDLDHIVAGLSDRDEREFIDRLTRLRLGRDRPALLFASTSPQPRVTGQAVTVLTLRVANLDVHRATGAPAHLWDVHAAPGTGVWKGVRVRVYARTDSTDTVTMS